MVGPWMGGVEEFGVAWCSPCGTSHGCSSDLLMGNESMGDKVCRSHSIDSRNDALLVASVLLSVEDPLPSGSLISI